MGLRDKPCIPLTTAAIIDFKRQSGGYDNDENVGKAMTYSRVFLQQLPQTLRSMVLVGLTDLRSITLILVRLNLSNDGVEELSFGLLIGPDSCLMSATLSSRFFVVNHKAGLLSRQALVQASKSWASWFWSDKPCVRSF